LLCLTALLFVSGSDAFAMMEQKRSDSSLLAGRTTTTARWAKKKKNGNLNYPTKQQRKESSSKATTERQPPSGSTNQANKKKRSAPPWQVLSSKEQAKNVEVEKKRRASVQLGISPKDTQTSWNNEQNSSSSNINMKTLSKAFLSESDSKYINWRRFNPVSAPASLHFVGAFLDKQLPPRLGVPEIAFLGKSNVGKSSLLNRLSCKAATRGDQARVGKTPGATASVNLYSLRDARDRNLLGWVDLPGFGYAKLSKAVQESVQLAAEHYLSYRRELALGILLVDIRRSPSDDDRAVLAALYDRGVPIVVVATKRDKVSSSSSSSGSSSNSSQEEERLLAVIRDGLGLPEHQPLAVSSTTGEGCRELWRIILEACETAVAEFKSQYDDDKTDDDDDDDVAAVNDEREEQLFDDSDDDYAYSQGYDWVHGQANVENYEDTHYYGGRRDDNEEAQAFDGDSDDDDASADRAVPPPPRETLKSLKKRARDMERRGEL